MPIPDFNKNAIDTLAKRASYKCSNPDCRVSTVGPNSEPSKASIIGEAAHIYGARPQSKRFSRNMSDAARAEITNGIWLCRNCHKLIDSDEIRYTSELLFAWREEHEKFAFSQLGSNSDKMQLEHQDTLLADFKNYPPIIRRIIIDKPKGWEWRLAAELMRYFNGPYFRKIRDLREGYYIKIRAHVSEENLPDWISQKFTEASNMSAPIEKLLKRLTLSFGEPGEPGDEREIHHICGLIRDYIVEVIKYEETLYFASVPENAENLLELIKDCVGSQVEKLEEIPNDLDEIISLIGEEHEGTKENPKVIEKTITFELPDGWEDKVSHEISTLEKNYSNNTNSGCIIFIVFIFIVFVLAIIFS